MQFFLVCASQGLEMAHVVEGQFGSNCYDPSSSKLPAKSFGWDIVVTQSHLCADCPAALISFGQPGLKQGRQAPESEDYNMGMSQNRCPFFPIQKYIFGPEKAQFPRHSHIDLRSGWRNHIIASTCS